MTRLTDFITDKRQPWFLPYNLFSKKTGQKKSTSQVVLTFDIEENYPDKSLTGVNAFLHDISSLLTSKKIPASFFVQGELIPQLAPVLGGLVHQKSDVGLHGFNHNNWGDPVWFWSEKPLTKSQKHLDLEKSIDLFQKYKLPRPTIFRAPNMNANLETLNLLSTFDFQVDSSFASFRFPASGSCKLANLVEVPVTSVSVLRVPFYNFMVSNLANLRSLDKTSLRTYLTSFDTLIFLAHPWEFYPNSKFTYCLEKNLAWLTWFIEFLQTDLHADFLTITDFAHATK